MSMRRLRQKMRLCCTKVSAANTFKLQQVSDNVRGCVQSWGELIDAGVTINGAYYCDVLLTHKLLLAMRETCAVFFIFQQCKGKAPAAAYRSCKIINLLCLFHQTFGHPTAEICTDLSAQYGELMQ